MCAELDDWSRLQVFVEEFPQFGGIESHRHRIRHRHENGLAEAGAVKKAGRPWLISASRFAKWLESRETV